MRLFARHDPEDTGDTHVPVILAENGRDDRHVFRRLCLGAPLVKIALIIPGAIRELEGGASALTGDVATGEFPCLVSCFYPTPF